MACVREREKKRRREDFSLPLGKKRKRRQPQMDNMNSSAYAICSNGKWVRETELVREGEREKERKWCRGSGVEDGER